MGIMQTYNNGNHYLLLNENGRLSDCICCCPIDRLLYLHVEPVFDDPLCVNNDHGPTDTEDFIFTNSPSQDFCEQAETDVYTRAGDNLPECYSGEGLTDVGVGAVLSCHPVNDFRLSLCFSTSGHPVYPANPDGCSERYDGLEPSYSVTCEAQPGEFFMDFGYFTPFEGVNDLGVEPSKPFLGGGCVCQFHIYIDEFADPSQAEQNNLYMYPAESSAGMGRWSLRDMIWYFETQPTIGTPLHPDRPPTMLREPDALPDDVASQLESL